MVSVRKSYKFIILLLLVAGVVMLLPRWMHTVQHRAIPLPLLFGNPEKRSPALSSDGTHIAYLAPIDNVLNIWVQKKGEQARCITHDTGRGISTYFWGYDNRTLFYVQDNKGDENWNLYAVDSETGVARALTDYTGVQVRILKNSRFYPHELVIAVNNDDKQWHDVYRLNALTGASELLAKNPGTISHWYVDDEFVIRLAAELTDDGGTQFFYRDDNQASWRPLIKWDLAVSACSQVLGYAPNHEEIFLADASSHNTAQLISYHVRTHERRVLYNDEQYDISAGLVQHPITRHPVLLFVQRGRCEIEALDPEYQADIDFLKRFHPGEIHLVSFDVNFTQWIVCFVQSTVPSKFYLYDRTTKQIEFLFCTQPELAAYSLADMKPIRFSARDGLAMNGYLTLPTTDAQKPYPTVLLVHGGPWIRDRWGLNVEAQFFANRGYACLQVNYRGSSGYGKAFLSAGNKEWGRAMQHDLADGVQWLIDQGIADAQRVAIFGGSYGGYAALAGVAFTPHLFCCAVDLVGISNLLTFIRSIPAYWKPYRAMLDQRIGNIDTEQDLLKERSPLFSVQSIRVPVLIGQGAHDPRVAQAESEQIVAALKENGVPCTYLLFPDEGHSFVKPENRLTFYTEAEAFLARHLMQ